MSVDVGQESFDPLDAAVRRCPHPHYARMRAEAPVQYVDAVGMYFVTRYDLVDQVLRDPHTFSSSRDKFAILRYRNPDDRAALAAVEAEGYPRVSTLIRVDPPTHTRYRRLVSKAFSPRAIAELEPVAREITTRLMDGWSDVEPVEFVSQFAVPLPLQVIARALNVPDDRLADFKRWSDNIVISTGANPSLEALLAAERGLNEFQHYFADALEQRRAHPQDDLLTSLLNARIDDDDPDVTDKRPLDLPEMLNLIQQVLAGGNETTTKLLTEMMLLLAEHPDVWSRMQREPSVIPAVVEESLRWVSVAQGMLRIATRTVELGGVEIPEGSTVVPMFASANRDEQVFDDPDRFEPDRGNLSEHVAFGKGPHYCLGASLTRLEVRVAMEELSRRVRSFTLSDSNDFAYNPSFLLRGLVKLDLDLVMS